jgi:predicted O-methyltransferase YrrM
LGVEVMLTRDDLSQLHTSLVAGLRDDYDPRFASIGDKQMHYLYHFAMTHGIKHVGQAGLGMGRSSFAFLSASSTIQVDAFDWGCDPVIPRVAARIEACFPGRHRTAWGKSEVTIPQSPNLCNYDLAYIDAGHEYEPALADMKNLAQPGRFVIADDYVSTWPGVIKAWEECVSNGLIKHLDQQVEDIGTESWQRWGWVVGVYV